ncbi:Fic family protein [Candidatus Parcubacteria bacterium]|nr:Fic family protein [Candidatus Parcubacteria bacterium]
MSNQNQLQSYVADFKEIMDKVLTSFEKVDLREIEKRNKELNSLRPLPAGSLKSLEEKLAIDEIHNSTAIEGNTLTLGETALVIEKGITISGKPLKDHLEVLGYNKALKFIKEIVKEKEKYPLNEDLMKEVHKILFKPMENLEKEYEYGIGFYRKNQRFIKGSRHVLPRPEKVPELMEEFVKIMNDIDIHPIKRAVLFHFCFTHIHPFTDGNGRAARLLMNLMLLRDSYPITIIPLEKRGIYINALEKASVQHDGSDFLSFIVECMNDVLNFYFSIVNQK